MKKESPIMAVFRHAGVDPEQIFSGEVTGAMEFQVRRDSASAVNHLPGGGCGWHLIVHACYNQPVIFYPFCAWAWLW
ncbi:MAG: hypothetical protein HYX62_05420 [Gammaproteobacteria bacterium]|nr:hypothetical protein [Gammaproteobacteria bacterium]